MSARCFDTNGYLVDAAGYRQHRGLGQIKRWEPSLVGPDAVQVATTGIWDDVVLGLKGGPGTDVNHANIGVSISGGDEIGDPG